jgi:hypothetical protein
MLSLPPQDVDDSEKRGAMQGNEGGVVAACDHLRGGSGPSLARHRVEPDDSRRRHRLAGLRQKVVRFVHPSPAQIAARRTAVTDDQQARAAEPSAGLFERLRFGEFGSGKQRSPRQIGEIVDFHRLQPAQRQRPGECVQERPPRRHAGAHIGQDQQPRLVAPAGAKHRPHQDPLTAAFGERCLRIELGLGTGAGEGTQAAPQRSQGAGRDHRLRLHHVGLGRAFRPERQPWQR